MRAPCVLLFILLFEAHAELILRHLSESQSLQLSCSLQQDHGLLTGLYLYRHNSSSQTTLLSLSEHGELRVDPVLRGRLRLSGRLDSQQVNVSIIHLQPADTGLYLWEQSYRRRNSSEQLVVDPQKVFVLVEGRYCWGSSSYHPLLLTICAAAGLLLMTLSCLAMLKCVKAKATLRHQPQPSAPIYEEMTRKQNVVTPQNNTPLHLEEVNFPVYANPNIRRQPQENYYACPRQL
ncbi:uncharacterized protein LOC141809287 [Halichoeres trimaculatus]|uniref:uncharacterized protein LOC141809287 n=1 Tax=Halichoeres trimaculatus TaxID=147232 RepID=UPI003D9E77F4